MTVTAPPIDVYGAQIDAQIATVQALVTANRNPRIEDNLGQQLNALQISAVERYMMTGWLNAATILLTYQPPSWDRLGHDMVVRIAYLQALYNTALVTPMPPGNVDGYGGSGWVTIAQNYAQALYAEQSKLVRRLMNLPGGTTAATMLANLTGFQTNPAGIPFQYVFSSVGFTDMDEDD
jgi:hypothetical protein